MTRGIQEIWKDDVTPLILDAFTLHLWVTPFRTCLMGTASPEGTRSIVWWPVVNVVALTVITFAMSLTASLHTPMGVCESPLFRSMWLFAAMGTVTRHIGASFGEVGALANDAS